MNRLERRILEKKSKSFKEKQNKALKRIADQVIELKRQGLWPETKKPVSVRIKDLIKGLWQ